MANEQAIVAAGEPVRHLLTVENFLTLNAAGAFESVGRVELIEREIFVMSPLYLPHARTGVPEYWVADVRGRRVIRMHDPVDGTYVTRLEFGFGDTIESATVAGLSVDTSCLA